MERKDVGRGSMYYLWPAFGGGAVLQEAPQEGPVGAEGETRVQGVEKESQGKATVVRRGQRVIKVVERAIGTQYSFRGPKSHRPVEVLVPNPIYLRIIEHLRQISLDRKTVEVVEVGRR